MSTVRTENLSNIAGNRTMTMDRLAQATPVAWVSFNGQGTVAIRAAYNVSSVTDLGTGIFQPNFTTSLGDGNYSMVGSLAFPYSGGSAASGRVIGIAAQGATSAQIVCWDGTSAGFDPSVVNLVFNR